MSILDETILDNTILSEHDSLKIMTKSFLDDFYDCLNIYYNFTSKCEIKLNNIFIQYNITHPMNTNMFLYYCMNFDGELELYWSEQDLGIHTRNDGLHWIFITWSYHMVDGIKMDKVVDINDIKKYWEEDYGNIGSKSNRDE